MPTYEYRCKSCGQETEVVQAFTDDALTTCEACGGPLRKVFGNVGIAFKGSGFYKNDSRGGSGSKASAGGSSSDSSSSNDSGSSSSDTKTETKDTKSDGKGKKDKKPDKAAASSSTSSTS